MAKRGGRKGSFKPGVETVGDGRPAGRSHDSSDRRPLRFWQPFNDWWRAELERLGRRPNAQEILGWYSQHAAEVWKEDAPSLQETRVHAKCLRSLPLVRDYFRNYRAKKRSISERSGSLAPADALDYRDYHNASDPDADPDYNPGRSYHNYGDHRYGDADPDADPDGASGDYGEEENHDEVPEDDAVAAAGLTQLANLRAAAEGSPEPADGSEHPTAHGGLPHDLGLLPPPAAPALVPPLPALAGVLNPGAAALWSAPAGLGLETAAAAAAAAAAPQQLLRNIALQQLHQQLALATLAQNLAASRAAGLSHPALQMLQQQHGALAAHGAEDSHTDAGTRQRLHKGGDDAGDEEAEGDGREGWRRRAASRGRGSGRPAAAEAEADAAREEEEPGPLPDPRSVPKRRRTGGVYRRRFGTDEDAEVVDAQAGAGASAAYSADTDDQPGASGRRAGVNGAAGLRGRSNGAEQGRGRDMDAEALRAGGKGSDGARGAVKRSGAWRPPPFASDQSDEAEPEAAREGGLAEMPTPLSAVAVAYPPALPPVPPSPRPPVRDAAEVPGWSHPSLEALPREALAGLSREQLVERVLFLQGEVAALWAAQQLPRQGHGPATTPRGRQQLQRRVFVPIADAPAVAVRHDELEAAEDAVRVGKHLAEEQGQDQGLQQPSLPAAALAAYASGLHGAARRPEAVLEVRTKVEEGQGEGVSLSADGGEGCGPPGSGVARLLPGPGGSVVTATTTAAAAPCDGEGDRVVAQACAAVEATGSGDNGGSPAGPASTDCDSRMPDLAPPMPASTAAAT